MNIYTYTHKSYTYMNIHTCAQIIIYIYEYSYMYTNNYPHIFIHIYVHGHINIYGDH